MILIVFKDSICISTESVFLLIFLINLKLLDLDVNTPIIDEEHLKALLVLSNDFISRHEQDRLEVVDDEASLNRTALLQHFYSLDHGSVKVKQDLILESRGD